MKNTPDHYLHFSKKEKNGIVTILSVTLLIAIAPNIYSMLLNEKPMPAIDYSKEIAALKIVRADSTRSFAPRENNDGEERSYTASYKTFEKEDFSLSLFYFDPNTLGIPGWQKLGVKEKTATGIRHYIEKGGRFRQPEDINKIWGLSTAMKERLLPYIKISSDNTTTNFVKSNYPAYEKKEYQKKVPRTVDVNTGDTSAFIDLPGIGSKLAARIINFREKLGGFYSVQQVSETFGLPDSTFQKIRPFLQLSAGEIKKININTVTLEELKLHPYIRWQLANVIIQYRNQHGSFSSVDDLKKIMIIKEDIFSKISPYCKVE
jgi:competence protein ComEA